MGKLLSLATNPGLYDNPAIDWSREGRGLSSPNRAHYWGYLKPLLTPWRGKNLLDIGAGTGWLLDCVLKEAGVATAIGIDPSSRSLAMAKDWYPHVAMIPTTLQAYRPRGKFDIALSVLSLLHIYPLEDSFSKIAKLLVSGGTFIAIVPDYDFFRSTRKGRTPVIEELAADECVTMIPRHYGTVADIVRKLEKYDQVARQFNFHPVSHKPMPPAPAEAQKYPELAKTVITHLLEYRYG